MTDPQTEFDQLRSLLKDMFQFEDHELDFGIYRITRLKRQFIQRFIDGEDEHSLRATVHRALSGAQNSRAETASNWLAAFAAKFGDMGRPLWEAVEADPGDAEAVGRFKGLLDMPTLEAGEREEAEKQLQAYLETRQQSQEQMAVKVYNHLLNFFELYYQNGDFGYNTRATTAFQVPYEADYDGADTLFHWKHKDSYYIKTGNGFHTVRFDLGGQWVEFRLAGAEEGADADERNNTRDDTIKHYRLAGIEPVTETRADGTEPTVWQVRFVLAAESTPKAVLYPRLWESLFNDEADLTPYLHKQPGKGEEPPGKPVFNDLAADYDKAEGGQIKGIGQLRLGFGKYTEELAKREEFKDWGSNAAARQEALQEDATARALWELDKNLNRFYVGNDADYFIHKDLRGFLRREKERFIKQVIFADLGGLLHAGEDNATTLIARAFNEVADTLIDFLAAIEDFQKALFEMKKKVVDTHYLISVGKIPEEFHARLCANADQLADWREVYGVAITDSAQLTNHPTLVMDTRLYTDSDPEFQDDLLSHPSFDGLDSQTDGVILNSESWQAVNLLEEKYRGSVSGGFFDPPYNTGNDEFLYKDNFRHSSWISMFDGIIQKSSQLFDDESVLWCTVDENEIRSVSLLGQKHSESLDQNIVIWQHSIQGKGYEGGTSLNHNYVVPFVLGENGRLSILGRKEEHNKNYSNPDNDPRGLWRPGDVRNGRYRPNLKYNIPTPSGNEIEPPENGWRWKWETMEEKICSGEVVFNDDETWIIRKIYLEDQKGRVPESLLFGKEVGTTREASNRLKQIFGVKSFSTPKPVGLVRHFVELSSNKNIFFDCFSGSGATAEAVLDYNKEKEDFLKFVLVDFDGQAFKDLVERVKRVSFCEGWKDGKPTSGAGKELLAKVQTLEQYEDVLDNLEPAWDEPALPEHIPMRYLFRPERNALSASLDLRRPFDQTIRVGKVREERTIDLMETWCYLQGYWVRSRRVFRAFDRKYLAVETTHGTLVVLRDVDDADVDTDNLNTLLAEYPDEYGAGRIQRLELNYDADLRRLPEGLDTMLISADDFLRGAHWS